MLYNRKNSHESLLIILIEPISALAIVTASFFEEREKDIALRLRSG